MSLFDVVSTYLKELNILTISIRIVLSILCGGVIGIEREKSNQAAGMRTYILVCMGSTLVMLIGQYTYEMFDTGDPARLGAQVISGIGFLGAGSIINEGHTKIRGLTTAAGLWASACIGLAIGIGFYYGGIFGTIAVHIVISKFRIFSNHLSHDDMWLRLYIEIQNVNDLQVVYSLIESMGLKVCDVILNNPKNSRIYNVIISTKNIEEKSDDEVINLLKELDGVQNAKFIY